MGIYRNVQTSFWTDMKVETDFTPEDKYFYLYLITNQYANICGCYQVSVSQMARGLGYREEVVFSLIERFENFHNLIVYYRDTKEVFIKNWYKYNWTSSPKLLKAVEISIEEIKNSEAKASLIKIFNNYILVSEKRKKKYGTDTVSIPYTYGRYTPVTDTVSDTVTVKSKNSFNNFPQNNYDFASLEKKLDE